MWENTQKTSLESREGVQRQCVAQPCMLALVKCYCRQAPGRGLTLLTSLEILGYCINLDLQVPSALSLDHLHWPLPYTLHTPLAILLNPACGSQNSFCSCFHIFACTLLSASSSAGSHLSFNTAHLSENLLNRSPNWTWSSPLCDHNCVLALSTFNNMICWHATSH